MADKKKSFPANLVVISSAVKKNDQKCEEKGNKITQPVLKKPWWKLSKPCKYGFTNDKIGILTRSFSQRLPRLVWQTTSLASFLSAQAIVCPPSSVSLKCVLWILAFYFVCLDWRLKMFHRVISQTLVQRSVSRFCLTPSNLPSLATAAFSSSSAAASSISAESVATTVRHPFTLEPHPRTEYPVAEDDRLFAVITLKGKQHKVTLVLLLTMFLSVSCVGFGFLRFCRTTFFVSILTFLSIFVPFLRVMLL